MASIYVPAVKKYPPSIIGHVLLSIHLSTPIIVSSTVDKIFFNKKKLPYLSSRDIVFLFLLTTITTYTIEYLQAYDYIPQIFKNEE